MRLPTSLKIFNGNEKTIVFNTIKHEGTGNLVYYQVTHDTSLVHQISNALYHLNIQSVLVEGGAKLLQSFIDEGMWNEARIIENGELIIENGLNAPSLDKAELFFCEKLLSDSIHYYKNPNT